MNSLVCAPSISGWYQRGSLPSWWPPKVWGKARVDFTIHSGKKVRRKDIMTVAILIKDGVGKGKLGMVTIICHSDQAMVVPFGCTSDACSMGFTWAGHGGDENLHQFSTLPTGILQPLFAWHSQPVRGCPNYWIFHSHSYTCVQLLLYSPNQVILSKEEKEVNELKTILIAKEAPWKNSIKEHCLSSLVPLLLPPSIPAASLSTYKDRGLQTDERLNFNTGLKQLQVVSQVKSQLKQELLCKQHEQDMRED